MKTQQDSTAQVAKKTVVRHEKFDTRVYEVPSEIPNGPAAQQPRRLNSSKAESQTVAQNS